MIVTLDFEAYYDKTHYTLSKTTTLEYIADERFNAYMVGIKIDNNPTQVFMDEDIEPALRMIDWSQAVLVCHNTKFDGKILAYKYGIIPAYYADTESMAHIVFGNVYGKKRGLNLHDVAQRCGLAGKVDKESLSDANGLHISKQSDPHLLERLKRYCAGDVDATKIIYDKFIHRIPLFEMDTIHAMVSMFTEPKLKIDEDLVRTIHEEDKIKKQNYLKNAEILVQKYMPEEPVVEKVFSSNKKYPDLLERMGLEIPYKARTSKEISTSRNSKLENIKKWRANNDIANLEKHGITEAESDEEAADRLTAKVSKALGKNDEFIQHYLEHGSEDLKSVIYARISTKSTQTRSRTETILNLIPLDKLFAVPLSYPGTHTLRAGGSDKMNMQNLPNPPAKLRQVFCAPEGHKILIGDSSQIEPRSAAWLTGEQWMLQAFRDNLDLYSANYARLQKRDYVELDKGDRNRKESKVLILQMNYQAGAGRRKDKIYSEYEREYIGGLYGQFVTFGIEKPYEECKQILAAYRESISNIVDYWAKLEYMLQRMTSGLSGRVCNMIYYKTHKSRAVDFDTGRWRDSFDGEIVMPCGTSLWYRDIRYEWVTYDDKRKSQKIRYSAWSNTAKRVIRAELYGGKSFENICQQLGSSVVKTQGSKILRAYGSSPFATQVHDEWGIVVPNERVNEIYTIMDTEMNRTPEWAPGLPVGHGGIKILETLYDI